MEQAKELTPEEASAKEDANKLLSEKVEQIIKLTKEAMSIADEHKLTFNFGYEVGGYGEYNGGDNGHVYDHGWQSSDICY